jgi:hypothetical protein
MRRALNCYIYLNATADIELTSKESRIPIEQVSEWTLLARIRNYTHSSSRRPVSAPRTYVRQASGIRHSQEQLVTWVVAPGAPPGFNCWPLDPPLSPGLASSDKMTGDRPAAHNIISQQCVMIYICQELKNRPIGDRTMTMQGTVVARTTPC